MPKWLHVPAKTANNKTATMKINFQVTVDYGEPELKELVEAIGDNENYYMTALPFPVLKETHVRGQCQFYDANGVHLDGDSFFEIQVRGCVWGWKGEPQSVIFYGTFQIGTFCKSGYGTLEIQFYGKHLNNITLKCHFKTIYKETKK